LGVNVESIGHVAVGCNGSVIELYPGFLEKTQKILDSLTGMDEKGNRKVDLSIAIESAIFGAAVGVACLDNETKSHNV
jgi:hexokinase